MQRKSQYRGLPFAATEAGVSGVHNRKHGGVNTFVLLAVSVSMLVAGGLVGAGFSLFETPRSGVVHTQVGCQEPSWLGRERAGSCLHTVWTA